MFGNLFNKAIAFITVPIFTRMLTVEEYGIINTYSSWVNIMAVVVGLSLGNSIRNAFVDMQEDLGKYISSIYTLACINFVFISVIVFIFRNQLLFASRLVWLCLIEALFNFVINAVIMRYVMEEEAKKRTMLLVFPNLIGAVLSVLLIYLIKENKYYGRIIGTCAATAMFGVCIMLYYMIRYKGFINIKFWKYALPISLPLVLHGLSTNVLGTSDRTFITYFCGADGTGVYSLIYNLSMVSTVLTSSAESVWIPRFTRSMQKMDHKNVNREIRIYIYTVLFAFCGLLTFAPELISILGGEEYLVGRDMIFPIVTSSFIVFLYSIYVNVEYYYKKTTIIAIATILAALSNLILNRIFIPLYGPIAAAYTTLVSYFISFLLHSINSKRIDQNVAPYKMLIIPISIILVAGIITSLISEYAIIRIGIMSILGAIYSIIVMKDFLLKK